MPVLSNVLLAVDGPNTYFSKCPLSFNVSIDEMIKVDRQRVAGFIRDGGVGNVENTSYRDAYGDLTAAA